MSRTSTMRAAKWLAVVVAIGLVAFTVKAISSIGDGFVVGLRVTPTVAVSPTPSPTVTLVPVPMPSLTSAELAAQRAAAIADAKAKTAAYYALMERQGAVFQSWLKTQPNLAKADWVTQVNRYACANITPNMSDTEIRAVESYLMYRHGVKLMYLPSTDGLTAIMTLSDLAKGSSIIAAAQDKCAVN